MSLLPFGESVDQATVDVRRQVPQGPAGSLIVLNTKNNMRFSLPFPTPLHSFPALSCPFLPLPVLSCPLLLFLTTSCPFLHFTAKLLGTWVDGQMHGQADEQNAILYIGYIKECFYRKLLKIFLLGSSLCFLCDQIFKP